MRDRFFRRLEKTAEKSTYNRAADSWARIVTDPLAMGALAGGAALVSAKETRGLVKDRLSVKKGLKARIGRRFSRLANRKARKDPKTLAGMAALKALMVGGGVGAGRFVHGRALRSRIERGDRSMTPSEKAINWAVRRKR